MKCTISTLKVPLSVSKLKFLGMRCIYSRYERGTVGDLNNKISYNIEPLVDELRDKCLTSHIASCSLNQKLNLMCKPHAPLAGCLEL